MINLESKFRALALQGTLLALSPRMTRPRSADARKLGPEYRLGETPGSTYRLTAVLARGGMGVVYRADHLRARRPVAVKVLSAALCEDESALARFRREADIVRRLAHPHIVGVLDSNTTQHGEPYFVMELLQGETLAQRCLEQGALPLLEAVSIVYQVASALRCAHDAGIVHRDLKPSNVFLVEPGDEASFAKLLDFGISKQADSETHISRQLDVVGTPEYMSPEQATGKSSSVDHRADQFCLAVMAYQVLGGQHPFWDDDIAQTVHKIVNEPAQRISRVALDLPAALDGVFERALAKRPDDRYASVTSFAAALCKAANCLSIMPPAERQRRASACAT